jgi:hypothetical protein
MMVGMMWFDNEPVTVEEKIRRAAAHYQKKYGSWPTRALVDPGMVAEDKTISGVFVSPSGSILKNTIWIGHEDAKSTTDIAAKAMGVSNAQGQ